MQTVKSGKRERPLRDELASERQVRVARERSGEVALRERVLLDRDVVQGFRRARVVEEGGAGDEEVQAETEARLDDSERPASAPALGERVAREEHVVRLRGTPIGRVIYIAVLLRIRHAAGVERQAGGH